MTDDIITRHQIFIEFVKHWQVSKYRKELPKLANALRAELSKAKWSNFSELSKRELKELEKRLSLINSSYGEKWVNSVLSDLRKIIDSDLKVSANVALGIKDQNFEGVEDYASLMAMLFAETPKWEGSGPDCEITKAMIVNGESDKIFDLFMQQLNPIEGKKTRDFLIGASLFLGRRITKSLMRQYANKGDIKGVINSIIGTSKNGFRDGDIMAFDRAVKTVVNDTTQHATSWIANEMQSRVFKTYMWCSIIDARTSEICRSLNRRIFVYGKGPIPPAHNNCRSSIRPNDGTQMSTQNWIQWLKEQPLDVKKEILGVRKGADFHAGKVPDEYFTRFDTSFPLNPSDLESKIQVILNR